MMLKTWSLGLCLCFFALSACKTSSKVSTETTTTEEVAEDAPEEEVDRFSYSYGLLIAKSLQIQGLDAEIIDQADFMQGFNDVFDEEAELLVDEQEAQMEVQSVMMEAQRKAQEAMLEEQSKMEEEKRAEEEAFFEENGKKKGIITTPSGLQYEILTEGNGKKPNIESVVNCHYHGTLLDGTVFDSSVERGEPTQFPVNRVIPGWTEVLQMMPVGSKWKVYIPFDLAYGARSMGPDLPAFSTLIFEIELISFE